MKIQSTRINIGQFFNFVWHIWRVGKWGEEDSNNQDCHV